jgi:hypothetical protein
VLSCLLQDTLPLENNCFSFILYGACVQFLPFSVLAYDCFDVFVGLLGKEGLNKLWLTSFLVSSLNG